ncbi:MAG TPA: DUF885 domain-containing protein [Gemmatimonadaceae bacterium]|nr:DUF885 domain-containing protein [Gemmatimonadaceae bacterium]
MSASLGAIIDGYLELRLLLDPVRGTALGRHTDDGRYARYDAESVREALAALRSYTGSLEEAEADTLDDEIDRTAALHAARHDVLVLERERPHEHDPSFHLSHLLNGVYLLLARPSHAPARQAEALLSRLRELPGFLKTAAEVIRAPRRPCVELARAQLPAARALVRDAPDDPGLDLHTLDAAELREARDGALAALDAFDAFLLERAEATPPDGTAPSPARDAPSRAGRRGSRDRAASGAGDGIGRELFDRKLHTAHLIRENADELARYGERLRADAEARLTRCAAEVTPGAHWRDVLDTLRADAPRGQDALAAFSGAAQRASAFVRDHALVSAPPADATVEATPSFLRPLIPIAAYEMPAVLAPESFAGAMYVTPPPPDASGALCHAELPLVALHEGSPGHHLHLSRTAALARPARRMLISPIAAEGWALYCEELMMETGFLETPAQRFFQAYFLLWRAVRVLLDVGLHARAMPVAEAERTLRDALGLDERTAHAEALRYAAHPTYQLCYAVGRRDILQLRDDARRAQGDGFVLRDFHDALLAYGALPTPLARWGMGLA